MAFARATNAIPELLGEIKSEEWVVTDGIPLDRSQIMIHSNIERSQRCNVSADDFEL